MIANFASSIAKKDVFDSWASAMASDRHAADSYDKYSKYFDMLDLKIAKKTSPLLQEFVLAGALLHLLCIVVVGWHLTRFQGCSGL